MFNSTRWEDRFGAISASHRILSSDGPAIFQEFALEQCKTLCKDPEFRVRNATGELLKSLISTMGPRVYEQFSPLLFKEIDSTFEREDQRDASSLLSEKEPEEEQKESS